MSRLAFHAFFDETGTVAGLDKQLQQAQEWGAKSALILAADGNGFTVGDVDPLLNSQSFALFGGIFPEIVVNERHYAKGNLVVAFSALFESHNISGLSDDSIDFIDVFEPLLQDQKLQAAAMVIVDGLSSRVASFLQDFYELYGTSLRLMGGGAGSLSFEQKPCVFSNQGLLKDTAQIINMPSIAKVSINHGWQPFAGPFTVTASDKTRVEAIDFKPAFDVYKSAIEPDADESFNDDNFFDLAKSYPLGMSRYGGASVVRDPLMNDSGTLVCVGEVPENQEIYLMKGEPDNLKLAARHCGRAVADSEDLGMALIFDCISRRLFLDSDFKQELNGVLEEMHENQPMFGALCLGEIAGNGDTALEFYNKTVVVGGVACGN